MGDGRFAGTAGRLLALVGGLVFILSLGTGIASYATRFAVTAGPWSLTAAVWPVVVDAVMFGVFALHHSIFARERAKVAIRSLVSPVFERSVYVWIASVLFIALCLAWQPVRGLAWQVPGPWSSGLVGIQIAGIVITLAGSRQLDVLDLSGVRQAFGRGGPPHLGPVRNGLYRLVRHPIYLGWVLMVWPTPFMTGTRLAFAAISTAYLVVAVPFEERSLRRGYGAGIYDDYARTVRWRIVPYVY